MLFGKWRNYDQWDAETSVIEIAISTLAIGADVVRRKILWRYTVRRHSGLWRNVIEEISAFVKRKNKNRVLPRRTRHQGVNDTRDLRGSGLNVLVRMLIQARLVTSLDERNRRECAILQIVKIRVQRLNL